MYVVSPKRYAGRRRTHNMQGTHRVAAVNDKVGQDILVMHKRRTCRARVVPVPTVVCTLFKTWGDRLVYPFLSLSVRAYVSYRSSPFFRRCIMILGRCICDIVWIAANLVRHYGRQSSTSSYRRDDLVTAPRIPLELTITQLVLSLLCLSSAFNRSFSGTKLSAV